MRDIMESGFNIIYLIIIWSLVIAMFKRFRQVQGDNQPLAKTFLLTFALLALGDTGHVGFRVIAYLNGGLDSNAWLVGMGKLATSLTITIFYMLLVKSWKQRFDKQYNLLAYILFASGIIRLIIHFLPGNQWGSAAVPFDYVMYRNIPLFIQGMGVVYLFLKDATKKNDQTFKWMAIMILVSFGFYLPVILFAQQIPLIGLLMIPKTIAYLVAAFVAYYGIYKNGSSTKIINSNLN